MRTHEQIFGAMVFALTLAGCPSGGTDEPIEQGEGKDDGDPQDESGCLDCVVHDGWEPNPAAHHPSMVSWATANEWTASRQIDDAYLCPGEDDWYHFDVASLAYTEHYLYIRALIGDAGLCGADCGDPVIPSGPRHAMTVEVYRADTLELLSSRSQDNGVLAINGPGGDAYAHELLIHVYSPTFDAEYPYRLSVEVRNYDGEDECEC